MSLRYYFVDVKLHCVRYTYKERRVYIIFCKTIFLYSFFLEKTRLVQKGRRKEGKGRSGIRGIKTSNEAYHCVSNELHIFTQFYLFSLFYVLSTPACNCYNQNICCQT